ncbi:MAG: 15-cis-phytoene synthase, partial [Acetobacteraceae bacterium]|nr:15-cis-phytoene synthase [Acetobacteraceae bacterium]
GCMNEAIAALVRRHDPDRFLTALFASPGRRDALLTLYAFNHELARAREVASEPPLALIRLQWWREVVEGEPKRHEVASPLSEAIAAGALNSSDLLPIIEAREAEAYGDFDTLADWRAWLLAGAGGLAVAAASALGAPEPELLRPFGAAYGVAGLARTAGMLAARGTCLLPRDLLAQHDLSPEAFVDDPVSAPALRALADVVREGQALLADAARIPVVRTAVAAALPAVLARRDLARWPSVAVPRRLGDRLAVVLAGVSGRILPRN